MCWETYKEINTAARAAEIDIPVLKVVALSEGEGGKEGKPYYMALQGMFDASGAPATAYRPGVTYRPSGFDVPQARIYGGYSADRGFHSYSSDCRVTWQQSVRGDLMLNVYSPSGALIDWMFPAPADGRLVVMRCAIPAGSRYYLNEAGMYMSDALRVDGFEEAAYAPDVPRYVERPV